MLRGIHKASATWIGKAVMAAIMGTLVVSFAIWGIGDIFRGFGQSTVAKIGGTEVTIERFRVYYVDKINQFGRRVGRPITSDQARTLGLDRQIVGQYVAEAALDERARALGLGLSNEEIGRRIAADPNFRGLNGQFDRNRFEQMIRQAGFNETNYVNEQRQLTIRRQVALSISGDITPPDTVLSAINRYQNETRNASYLMLGAAQAGTIAAPTEDVLKSYFEERKVLFRAPETRKVTLLPLSPADQARWSVVSDADARANYEQTKSDYGTPERRQLRQIVFANIEEARAASERIKSGTSFVDIAKERGLKDSDIDLGAVARTSVIDPAVADAAFALAENGVSAPVQGRFGAVLVQAIKILPDETKSFESVQADIKRKIAEGRARIETGTLRDKIEDERASGATLAETARKLGLTARMIDSIDRSGRDASGKPVSDVPGGPELLRSIFATDVGVESDPVQIPGGGYLWFDVTSISPSRERTMDEVKDQIGARWRDDEIASRLKAKADDMLAKIRTGAALDQLASEIGGKAENASGLQRGKATDAVPANVVDTIFKTAKGAAAVSEGSKTTEQFLFVVTDVIEPKPDPALDAAKNITVALKNAYGEDLVTQYVGQLEKDLGVTINQAALNQVTGAATN